MKTENPASHAEKKSKICIIISSHLESHILKVCASQFSGHSRLSLEMVAFAEDCFTVSDLSVFFQGFFSRLKKWRVL